MVQDLCTTVTSSGGGSCIVLLVNKSRSTGNEFWLKGNPKVDTEARCKLCKISSGVKKIIKIAEGYSSIEKHASGAKHKENVFKAQRDPNHNKFDNIPQLQISMEEAFENAGKKRREDDEKKSKLLNAQVKFAAMIAHHNILSPFNTLFLTL